MESSELIIQNNNENLIVCFGGFAASSTDIPRYDFLNFLQNNFLDFDKIFYRDIKQVCYHNGIDQISDSIETTLIHLENRIKNYKRVIFTGNSAGAYASILFGSLLNVSDVIVFNPVTKLIGRKDIYNIKYIDLSKNIINNTTTYYLYGDSSIKNKKSFHHIKDCINISKYKNVKIKYIDGIDLRKMRDNNELFIIYNSILTKN